MTLLMTPRPDAAQGRTKPSRQPVRPAGALPFPQHATARAPAPRLSVLIPAHDAAHRLPRAVRSVLAQSVSDIEVLVVDDASSDRTAEVAEALAAHDQRVQVIRTERNLGPGGARNRALQVARAPWIALLDSDDTFLPGRLSRLLRYAEQSGANLVADNLILRDDAAPKIDQPMFPRALLDRPRWIDASTFVEGNLPIPGHPRVSFGFLKPIISRRFLERHGLGYRDGLRFAEDYDLYLRCLLAGARWLLVPEPGYAYRVRGDSLTARHGATELARLRALDRSYLDVASARLADPRLEEALRTHLRSVEDRLIWRLVLAALRRARLGRALRLTLRSRHDLRQITRSLLRELPRQLALRLARSPLASGLSSNGSRDD